MSAPPIPPPTPVEDGECDECGAGRFVVRTGKARWIRGRGDTKLVVPDDVIVLWCNHQGCERVYIDPAVTAREAIAKANGFPRVEGYLTVTPEFADLVKSWRDAFDMKPRSIKIEGERYFCETNGYALLARRDDAALPPPDDSDTMAVQEALSASTWEPVDVSHLSAWLCTQPSNEGSCPECNGKGGAPARCFCCGGDGGFRADCQDPHCHHLHEVDCDTCDGSGLAGGCTACKGTHVVWLLHAVSVFGVHVAPTMVLRVLDLLGRDDAVIERGTPISRPTALLLRGPGWRFIMMPMNAEPIATYESREVTS